MNRHLIWIALALLLVVGGLVFYGQHHAHNPSEIEAMERSADQS